MSRLARKPIAIEKDVTVAYANGILTCKGKLGEIKVKVGEGVAVELASDSVSFKPTGDSKQIKSNLGTSVSLFKNAMQGVKEGFTKVLEIEGVGFRGQMEGKTLVLNLGFVNPVRFTPPEGVTIVVEKNILKISGIDKEVVGQAAAQIRSFKKPEPYKGKGIRYQGEIIRLKVGKKAAAAG